MTMNRQVEALIQSAEWMIEPIWGMQQLRNYLAQLELLDKGGAKYADLGFAEMRAAAKPSHLELMGSNKSGGKSEVSAKRVTHLKLSGVMKMEDGSYTYGAKTLASFLRDSDASDNTVGHIIEVNSGGGEALAGGLMYETIRSLKKPVYALVHLAASAAYLTIVGATKIYMQSEFSSLGSIGVMASIDKELLELYRTNVLDIYAPESSEKNEEYRQLVRDGKTELYEKRLSALAQVFHAKVTGNRPNVTLDTLKGRVYIGESAREKFLADGYSNISELAEMLLNGKASFPAEVQSEAEDSDDEAVQLNGNKIKNDMTLQQRMSNALLRFCGINVPGTDAGMEQAIIAMDGMTSLQEQIDAAVTAAVSPLNERLTDMTQRLEEALKTRTVDTSAEVLKRLDAIEAANKRLADENAQLSKRILDLANDEASGDEGANNQFLTETQANFRERERVTG